MGHEWATVSVGDVCEFKYGKSLPDSKRSGGSVPVFGSNGIVGHHNSALTDGPTIVVGRKGSLGEVNWSRAACWPIDTTYYVDRTATSADLRWLAFRLAALGLTELNRAAAVPGLNRDDAYRKTLLLPPLAEQRRIADILDRADALRTKRRAALALLDSLTQSIFLDMFGDPVANPHGWPAMSLGELLVNADVFVDGDWVESKDQDPDGDVRLIQLADVGDGFYVDKSARFMNRAAASRLRCTTLRVGDVLVARMPDPLGRACMFPGDSKEAVTVVDVCIIRPEASGPNPVWLMNCINTPGFRHLIARQATGTTRERISRGNLTKLVCAVPPLPMQLAFSKQASAAERLKAAHRASLAELDALFASLQHRAFRGEL